MFQNNKNAEHIPEKIFAIAWTHQLGSIEPPAIFSFVYPIHQPIPPVKAITINALTIPTAEKNIMPCSIPKRTACIMFPTANPNLFEILF